MKKNNIAAFVLCLGVLAAQAAQSQGQKGFASVLLKDSTEVSFLLANTCPNCYYYLPTNFKVARNTAGQPEISLLKISETENDPITSGILHILLSWGLDGAQEAEFQEKLRSTHDSLAVVIGAISVNNTLGVPSLTIDGDDALAKVLREGVKGLSEAAVSAGAKMALSFKFDEAQVSTLLKYLEKKKKSDARFTVRLVGVIPYKDGLGSYPLPINLSLSFSDLYPLFQ